MLITTMWLHRSKRNIIDRQIYRTDNRSFSRMRKIVVTSLLVRYFKPSITCPTQDRTNLEWIGPVQCLPLLSLAQLIKSNFDRSSCLVTFTKLKIAFLADKDRTANQFSQFNHLHSSLLIHFNHWGTYTNGRLYEINSSLH